jgi:hypothetical protein
MIEHHGEVYHWRHGWIPLTHAAAMQKAHDNRAQAEKLVPSKAKRARRTPQHIHDYRAARADQDRRFEEHTGGGVSARDTRTQEYRDYFGTGDHGTSTSEKRITYREHLRALSTEKKAATSARHTYKAGVALGKRHQRARLDTATENSEFDAAAEAAGNTHGDYFANGYGDGLAAAYEQQTRSKTHPLTGAQAS